jgi:hypothetical protein
MILQTGEYVGRELAGWTDPQGSLMTSFVDQDLNPWTLLKGMKRFEYRDQVWGLTSSESPDIFLKVAVHPVMKHYLSVDKDILKNIDSRYMERFIKFNAYLNMNAREYLQKNMTIYNQALDVTMDIWNNWIQKVLPVVSKLALPTLKFMGWKQVFHLISLQSGFDQVFYQQLSEILPETAENMSTILELIGQQINQAQIYMPEIINIMNAFEAIHY